MARNVRCTRAVLLVVSLLLATSVLPQEQPPPRSFAEEIEVRIIDVDVVVTDKSGRPIPGLTREDFELLEDGKPVEIRYFTAVSEMTRATEPAAAAPAPAPTSVVAPVVAAGEGAPAPVTWIVFIDQTNMHPSRRNRTLRHLQSFMTTSMAPGDRAILASNDGLAMRIRQNLTNDRKVVLDSLVKLEKERVHQGARDTRATQVRHEIRDIENEAPLRANRPGEPAMGSMYEQEYWLRAIHLGTQIAVIVEEEAQRARNAVRSMEALVDVLAGVEGRLALVYVGAGMTTLPGLDLVEEWRNRFPELASQPTSPRPEDHKEALNRDVTRLYENMNATRVTVYTIYAGNTSVASAEYTGVLTTQGERPGDLQRSTESGLAREMADRTGGLYFEVNPDLTKQLQKVRMDLSNYYALGYVPQGKPGQQHRIKVRVKTEGARVRHREAVRERTRPEEAGREQVASLLQPPKPTVARVRRVEASPASTVAASEANPLGVRVEAAPPQRDGWGKDFLLPFDLQLGSLTFVPKGNVHRAEFVLHFALVDPNGTIWPIESREHSLEIPNAEVPKGDDQISFRWHVDLAPLRVGPEIPIKTEGMKLTVTVEDRASKVRSVITVPVQKPGQPYFGES